VVRKSFLLRAWQPQAAKPAAKNDTSRRRRRGIKHLSSYEFGMAYIGNFDVERGKSPMPFSFSTFGTLLSEFQKYLSDRIPKAVYYSIGLVFVVLGILVGYIIGWSTIEKDWNHTDAFYKIVLGITVTILFFIIAYTLGSLQGTVERLFQGEWPLGLGKRNISLHRDIWEERYKAWKSMENLHHAIKNTYDQAIQWREVRPVVVQTKRALPRYHVIEHVDEDLVTIPVDSVPAGALQDPDDAKKLMIQRPLGVATIVTSSDLVSLPCDMSDMMVVPVTLLAEAIPAGLLPGDTVSIYAHSYETRLQHSLNDAVIIDIEPVSRVASDSKKLDLVHLTLALPAQQINEFITLSNDSTDKRLCAVRCPAKIPSSGKSKAKSSMTCIDIPEHIKNRLDAEEQKGKAKIHLICRDGQWEKSENTLNWQTVDPSEKLRVAFHCSIVVEGEVPKLSVPEKFANELIQDNVEKLDIAADDVPLGWGYWEAKKVTHAYEPKSDDTSQISDLRDRVPAGRYPIAGFVMSKEGLLDEYNPESYFGLPGLLCEIEPSQQSVTFLIGFDENRITEDMSLCEILLYKNRQRDIEQLKKERINTNRELMAHISSEKANKYRTNMAKALVLLELFRHPVNILYVQDPQLEAWRDEINELKKTLIGILKRILDETEYKLSQSHKWFHLYYPSSEAAIAPTGIGNVIHAVDSYCQNVYGLDTALILPRLQTLMSPDIRKQLSTAHDQLALIEWLLLAIITICSIGTILALSTGHVLLAAILWLLILPASWYILQRAALAAALDYATTLRLVYDRERGKVISMLGLSRPSSMDQSQEKSLWRQVEQWLEYGEPPGKYTLNLGGSSNETKE